MATRDKKARSVTADSPTPSLGSANSGSSGNISALAISSSSTGAASGNDSAPTTPTSTRKAAAAAVASTVAAAAGSGSGSSSGGSGSTNTSSTRGSLSRLKSKQQLLQQGTDEGAVDELAGIESIASAATTTTTTPSRTTRGGSALLREDSAGRESPAAKDDTAATTTTTAGLGGASKDLTKSPAIGARRAAATATTTATTTTTSSKPAATAQSKKKRVVTLKRTGLLKRKGKKIIGKPMLGRKVEARRQLVTAAKSTGTRGAAATVKDMLAASKEKEEEATAATTPSLRNGKPRNSDSPVAKRKAVLKQQEAAGSGSSSKSPDSASMERRRSGSILTEDGAEQTVAEMKRELLDYESRSKMLDKMAEAFNERKAAGGGAASPVVEKGTLRRSMRQRKSTAREELAPPARGKSVGGGGGTVEIKLEPAESLESLAVEGAEQDSSTAAVSVDAPLTIDTTVATVDGGVACEPLHSDGTTVSSLGGVSSGGVIAGASGTAGEEVELGSVVGIGGGNAGGSGKDPSLSPGELVSEGVSEQSVKECYSEPAFLENNLGIEKDPKLGEIVQGRFRCDKVSDDAEDNAKSETVGDNAASDNGEEGGSATKDADEVEEEEEEKVAHEAGEGVETVQKVKQEVQEDPASVSEDREITIEGVKVEEEPMEQDEEEEEEEIGKELPVEEKMDITEEEVVECVKIKEEPEEDVAAVVLEEAKGDGDTPSQTDNVPAKDTSEAQESNHRPDSAGSAVDEEAGAPQASSAGGAVVAPSDGEVSSSSTPSKTPTDDASSPVPVASVPCKANGDSNGTTTGDQSTPNQQSSRAGGQQRPSTGATPKTASKSSSTPVASPTPATGKESKPKTRTTKEKSKEDEKTREEKLRQEKLRVEEKVREEKQRAERLEAERRLKEEQQQQQQLQQQVLENGHEEEQPSPASGSGGPQDEQEHKTDTAPVPALLALGGLNLPAITIALTSKKDGGSSDEKEEAAIVPKKCELEILPIKADGAPPPAVVLLSKEEKPAKEGGAAAAAPSLADTAESRSRTASKGENAAAALSAVAERKDSSNKSSSSSSPLTVLKQGTSNGSPSPPPATDKDAASTATTTPPDESDDAAKASHLLNLGLLTIRAADEEKQRRAEQKPSSSADGGAQDGGTGGNSSSQGTAGKGSDGWLAAGTAHSGGGSGRAGNKSTRSSKDEYTVSMKTTVLKGGSGSGGGSRGEKRKQQRMPLKMTFQKGKGKGGGRESSNGSGSVSSNGSGYATDTGNNGDNTFYTVHSNELDHHSSNSSDGHSHRDAAGGRKAHSRSHTTDGVNLTEAVGESVSSKEVSQKSLVIPEKASSFNVHPERLCRDQCSYCGGKFGLYDTPCHVAAIKSTERQQRILLATLPKITLDSCLCDACYRHVDRKANCPPQKKKSSTVTQTSASTGAASSSSSSSSTASNSTTANNTATQSTVSPLVLKVTTNKDGSTSIATEQPATAMEDGPTAGGKAREICAVRQCTAHAMQSLRRKWMVKMKRKIGKQLDINLEQAAKATAEYISICNKHYEQISHLMICAMCTKPLQRNHVYHLYNNVPQLERLIQEQGISMRLSSSELVVCKLCKYYANLLIKPPEPKTKKAQFVNDYNRRLLCRQRAAEEQREQQAEAAVTVTAVAPAAAAAAPRQRQPMPVTDIVISDGDEEEEEAEDEEVEETTITETQSQQQPLPARYQTLGDIFSIGDSSVSVRRRVSSRKSPDVTIVESNGATQMSELEEISIIPTSKSLSALHQQQQQQQQSRDDNIDMTQVLKSNPNISMRELFPGEEELGVHVNIPFSSSSMRTPEGWTKVQSTIQYDDSTRALWEELQKPYGNQSSFLRHLLLLEKYFRNGDLVLSPQAKTSATTYSEAVQNRLRSYDNVPSVVPSSPPALASLTPAATPTVAADKTSHIFQQFSSATITIVPANKVRPRTSAGGGSSSAEITPVSPPAPVSLLKSNNLHLANSGDQGTTKQSLKRKLSIESGGRTSGGASAITSPLNTSGSSSTVGGGSTKVVRLDEPKAPLSSPPELISISNRKASVTITTIPPAAAQSATVGTAPAAVTATAQKQLSLLQQPQQSLLQSVAAVDAVTAAAATLLAKKSPTAGATATTANTPTGPSSTGTTANASGNTTAREIIQMPEQLTEAERRESSTRPWRPTLLPIAPGVSESLKTGPLYQTADGRTLPKLVQVMSGGKPYHISIEDYNRMCILRREKLLQQQQNMMQQQQQQQQTVANKRQSQLPQPNKQPSSAATTLPPPPALRLASSAGSVENNNGSANSVAVSVASSAKVVQLPNQLLEQNSLIPILSGSSGANKMGNVQKNSSLTVTMTTTVNNNSLAKSSSSSSSSSATVTVPPSMKPLSLPNSTTVYPMLMSANTLSLPSLFATSSAGSLPVSSVAALFSEVNAAMTQTSSPSHRPAPAATSLVLGQPTSLLTTTTSSSSASAATAATAAVLNPFEHLFKDGNKVTQAQLQEFVAIATAANGGGSSSLLDNSSPAQLLSKIPKSLTVIPQQKQRSMSRVSSHEDQNSA
ncbi:mucin-19 [Anopheles merus]|uniref:mucin-19 n=1 Tax=Anopheles merus TaxID=30066 RepID=UPI001BE43BB1|nr:mucin-19 [Anopheles merus]XP_041767244.1 mucin-19 [Anopheles merus]XP_041767245.1 mucin-19 [Anopheles merus]XP_041767246.1 mucin-19 [Anopheles merus]XP_041767247.1 mucin-19 [Anopheles merus]